MPLDPVLKAFLDQVASMGGPKTWEMTPAEARESFAALMQLAGPKDIPIGKVTNIAIPAPHGEIAARAYAPVAASGQGLPTLVFFHGGGWVIGNIDTHDGLCRMIANGSGCRVISVEYRLSPESKYPDAVDDAVAALEWVEKNAAQLGVDANLLAVGGDSAGGALAAVVAQIAKAKGGPKLSYQLLLFPVTQIGEETRSLREYAEGYFLERKTLDWFYAHYLPGDADRKDPRISPLVAEDVSGLPPAYVMLAGFDPLHDEGLAYAEKLRAAGVPVTVADYPDMVHDFIYLQSVLPQASEALNTAAKALKDALS
ncbi:MAG: alpha/beta hydrolase [Proteobacteria bacterium]|jgi:acetyl esterase|nr:alpha/beta hydrolase [Pseudomonadota bacterium]